MTDPNQQALDLINAWEAGAYLHPAQKKAALQVAIRDALIAAAPPPAQPEQDFLRSLVENVFSWALQDCNYLSHKDADAIVEATRNGMKPEQAAVWRADRAAPSPAQPDMRRVCEALGFDPTNHHNAAKCPYCTPSAQDAPAADEVEANAPHYFDAIRAALARQEAERRADAAEKERDALKAECGMARTDADNLRRENRDLKARLEEAREVVTQFRSHYPMGINLDLDDAYRAALAFLARQEAPDDRA